MNVTKRNGSKEPFDSSKLSKSLADLSWNLNPQFIKPQQVVDRVGAGIYNGVSTYEVSTLCAETAASMTTIHPHYSKLAARISVACLHKQTPDRFSDAMTRLYNYRRDFRPGESGVVSDRFYKAVMANRDVLDEAINNKLNFELTYFGFKTMERSYLLRTDGKIVERPQYLFMRVAVGIHGLDVDRVLETYRLMSQKFFTHASPTLFNAGTSRAQLSSCFLVAMEDDSIEGIFDTLKNCAVISKTAGGVGLHVHNIRANGSYIAGSNGQSNGIVPMLRVFNSAARYVDQGGSKRPGAFAVYLEPWHADIFDFLQMRKNHGKEEMRARDLFYALWIPDLFMKKVEANEDWCLFSPDTARGLSDVWGAEFEALYNRYEGEGRFVEKVRAQKLWKVILEAQTETGNPFMLYKDACNRKSNQRNLGTIRSSNLCTEIVQYSSPDEIAVCNLASLALPSFVVSDNDSVTYDFQRLHDVTKVVLRNLDTIIDINDYPVDKAERSNKRHRPVSIGVQGLADVFMMLRLPFECQEARDLNSQIFETIYHGAVEASIELAAEKGTYETYQGSPASEGQLQFDLWGVKPSDLWDWNKTKQQLRLHGLRNSLLVGLMPTASTSQILGFNECFEPLTSNVYTRRVLSGEYQIVNEYLVDDLVELGLWDEAMRNRLISDHGSVQNIGEIPDDIRSLYKTAWELSQRVIIDMAADRGAYIDQSQSLNIFMANPTMGKLTSMHLHGWKKGLKTGMYYLRTQAAAAPIQFTVDQEALKRKVERKAVLITKKRPRYVGVNRFRLDSTSPSPAPFSLDSSELNSAATSPSTMPPLVSTPGSSSDGIYDSQILQVCQIELDNCEVCSS